MTEQTVSFDTVSKLPSNVVSACPNHSEPNQSIYSLCTQAEEAAQSQANEVTILEKQLKRYEEGEYGLSEAIAELKATRLQLNSKERQLEEVCRLASQAESSLNEINLENEHLRSKLGIPLIEKIDLNGYRRQKRAEVEEDRAVNIILQKEVRKHFLYIF
ncbi:unnamed protein product [Schistosoma curassoni]|uniref:Uncharacterized protein n=1 Tax=Schistosoma curassoni TaxID=6186 RepID=A0A183JVH5_9TREM|nr:unnamed protein product [Schistosoma curassoni]